MRSGRWRPVFSSLLRPPGSRRFRSTMFSSTASVWFTLPIASTADCIFWNTPASGRRRQTTEAETSAVGSGDYRILNSYEWLFGFPEKNYSPPRHRVHREFLQDTIFIRTSLRPQRLRGASINLGFTAQPEDPNK